MRNLLRLASIFFLLASLSVQAVEPNKTGDLSVIVALSKSLKYLHTWVSTPPEAGVPVPRLRQIMPEETGYAAFIVTGISANDKNEFNYSVSWRLISPSGEIVFAYPSYARGNGQLNVLPAFYMADPALDIIFEQKDSAGIYILEATAIDHVSGQKSCHSYQLRLMK